MASPDVRLTVTGKQYGGWTTVRIQRSLEQAAGGFSLSVTERWPGQAVTRPIKPGQSCTLAIDDEVVITGYVDAVDVEYGDGAHTVALAGRDKTGDLVDCSAPATQFSGRTLAEVARQLCGPFSVGVKVQTDVGDKFAHLKNTEGDSVWETLEAAARVRAVMLMSDGLGNLVICRAGTSRAATLTLGEHILKCRGQYSHLDRFSTYTVKGQRNGGDDWYGESAAQAVGTATDSNITRHRPLTLVAEESVDGSAAKKRAKWEAAVRYGRGRRVVYTVKDWTHAGGLWAPNTLIRAVDAFLGLNCDLLLAGVGFILDDQGLRSDLTLVPPEAYQLLAVPETGDGEGGW